MISFLITIDFKGFINDIKWSNPPYLVTTLDESIYTLLSKSDKTRLQEFLENKFDNHSSIQVLSNVSLTQENEKFRLFILPIEDLFMICGIDEEYLANSFCSIDDSIDIVSRFMDVAKDCTGKDNFNTARSARYQFEKIQHLNNELINTKRLLEKANVKLNELNEDLNNKLVKDSLTGLLSRYQYRREIENLISQSPKAKGIFAFIDIDGFKKINDTYGHGFGDLYLIEFAKRLKKVKCENSLVMRIAGDEFGIYVHDVKMDTDQMSKNIWERLRDEIVSPSLNIDGNDLSITISAGMAVYNEDTEEIYELIEFADFAMYVAKRAGKNNYHKFQMSEYEKSTEYKG